MNGYRSWWWFLARGKANDSSFGNKAVGGGGHHNGWVDFLAVAQHLELWFTRVGKKDSSTRRVLIVRFSGFWPCDLTSLPSWSFFIPTLSLSLRISSFIYSSDSFWDTVCRDVGNTVPWTIFGHKAMNSRVIAIHDLHSLSNIIRVNKSRIMRWAGHVVRLRYMNNAYSYKI